MFFDSWVDGKTDGNCRSNLSDHTYLVLWARVYKDKHEISRISCVKVFVDIVTSVTVFKMG